MATSTLLNSSSPIVRKAWSSEYRAKQSVEHATDTAAYCLNRPRHRKILRPGLYLLSRLGQGQTWTAICATGEDLEAAKSRKCSGSPFLISHQVLYPLSRSNLEKS